MTEGGSTDGPNQAIKQKVSSGTVSDKQPITL
jgi:hypothetical protein